MVRVLYIFVLVSLLSLSVVNAQNEMHWKKVFHGQVGPYTEGVKQSQYVSADTIYFLTEDAFYGTWDGGNNFFSVPALDGELSFHFPTSKIGYMVGWNGLFKKTNTGGQIWNDISLYTQRPFLTVRFLDENIGLIAGAGVFRTVSGGWTWGYIETGFEDAIWDIKWITPKIVIIGCKEAILRSTDGGVSFTTLTQPNGFGYVYNIEYYDPAQFYKGRAISAAQYDQHFILASGRDYKLHKSTDYGITWRRVPTPAVTFEELVIADGKQVFAYAWGAETLWESKDGGESWQQYPLPQDLVPEVFSMLDAYNLFGMRSLNANVPRYFIQYKYQDEDIVIRTPCKPNHIFSNKQRIPVTWRSNKVEYVNIEYTTDNGSTWYLGATVPAVEQYLALELPDASSPKCFVRVRSASNPTVGDTCDYSFSVQPELWHRQSPPISGNISSVTYPTPSVAYCGTKNGVLLKSIDSAKTWQTIHTGANADITAVTFLDEQNGLIGTANGKLMRTHNGGQSWIAVGNFDTTLYVKKILRTENSKIIMLQDGSSRMSISHDGGYNWMTSINSSIDIIRDMDVVGRAGYAVGNNGLLLRSGGEFNLNFVHWEQVPAFTTADLRKVSFGSDRFGYVFTENSDSVFVTEDGFRTHKVKPFPVSLPVLDLKATSPYNAFILLQGGYLYATDNFAESWEDQTHRFFDTLQTDLHSLAFITSSEQIRGSHAVAVGDHGAVYRRLFYEPEPVSVSPKDEQVPYSVSLAQNYPNPFNPSTTLEFTLPKAGFVTLKVYDVLGSVVQVLVQEVLPAGEHTREFFAQNLPSGIYLSTLQTGDARLTRKMILVK